MPFYADVEKILKKHFDLGYEVPFNFKPDFVTHKLAKYLKLANIKDANVHVLRKTFGSLLIQNKLADIYEVSKLLGHSSVKVTEAHYVDLLKENIEKPIAELSKLIIPK